MTTPLSIDDADYGKRKTSGHFINLGVKNSGPDTAPAEFINVGRSILDSEDMTDMIYEMFLALLAKTYVAGAADHQLDIADVGELVLGDLYVPCVERIAYTRQIDQRNDGLPAKCQVAIPAARGKPDFFAMRRLERLPRGTRSPVFGIPYRLVAARPRPGRRADMNAAGHDVLEFFTAHVTVSGDRITHCLEYGHATAHAIMTTWAAMAFNVYADRRSLWNVRTAENLIGSPTGLALGVDPEAVKSLFYARDLPLTETGRKRPILHWVRAHLRRVASGIDIDITQHLRGIERFAMHGLDFEITSPRKAVT